MKRTSGRRNIYSLLFGLFRAQFEILKEKSFSQGPYAEGLYRAKKKRQAINKMRMFQNMRKML